jgi:HlyD family secretion protein
MHLDQLKNGTEERKKLRSLVRYPAHSQTSAPQPGQKSTQTLRNLEQRTLAANKFLRLLSIVIAIVLLSCLVSCLYSLIRSMLYPQTMADAQHRTTITATPAQFQEIHRTVSADGAAMAWESIAISPEVGGLKIDAVLVKEGDHVKRGQPLANLSDSVLRAEYQEMRAQLQATKANLQKAIQPNRREEIASLRAAANQSTNIIGQADASVEIARTRCSNAEDIAKRFMALLKDGAVTQVEAQNRLTESAALRSELIRSEQEAEAARQSGKQAEQRLSLALNGGRREDISVCQASVMEAQARLNKLQALLAQTVVRAPEDGLILKSNAHHGEIAIAGQALFSLVRDDRLEVKVNVPEAQFLLIRPGQAAKIKARRNSCETISGRVREVSPSVDITSRLGSVRIDIPRCDRIVAGMFFHVVIDIGEDHVLTVPKEALLDSDGQAFVFLLQGNRVKKVGVRVGEDFGDNIEIKTGLEPGQPVAVCGAPFLTDSEPVKVVDQ